MKHQSRNGFEHFSALAEIEQDPDKFLEIKHNLVCILEGKASPPESPADCNQTVFSECAA